MAQVDALIHELKERAKELNCLYKIEDLLSQTAQPIDKLFYDVIALIPSGFQYPELCQALLSVNGKIYKPEDHIETHWTISENIIVQGKTAGKLIVSYKNSVPSEKSGYFLKEEYRLIRTIADRIAHTLIHNHLKSVVDQWDKMQTDVSKHDGREWTAIIHLLMKTDQKLFNYLSQKMLYHLCWQGVEKARNLLAEMGGQNSTDDQEDSNRPSQKKSMNTILKTGTQIFQIASEHISGDIILKFIQKWIQEEKGRFLIKAIDDPNASLSSIIDALTRYHHLESEGVELSESIRKGLRVSLIRRFFSSQLEFINIAKDFFSIGEYYDLVKRLIFSSEARGRLGGKSAGLFLAEQILKKVEAVSDISDTIRVPKTWYITSDGLMNFIRYNNFDDVIEHKYKEMDEIHLEYPNLVQLFKISEFPPDILRGLSAALDDFGDQPIIVRSSSLLEDSLGAAFSGKYKSLFLANQGSKEEKLEALTDAIAEIYASTFAPDPIEYRAERGLLDFFEEMGIMIQEVVGTRVGDYFFPAFAGVAFSRNEFRWSPRIEREDGLLRLVPGLGTRAVDRVADDYPVLVAPGKPGLNVHAGPEEVIRYAPKYMDVINFKSNQFETVEASRILAELGNEIPGIENLISIVRENHVLTPSSVLNIDFETEHIVFSFNGMFTKTNFIKQIRTIMETLEQKIKTPVDVELAHDGKHLYILQCRPQCSNIDNQPAPIPKDLHPKSIIFTAEKFVTNGAVPTITHIVYVPAKAYSAIGTLAMMQNIGRIIGRLNKILPKKQFILIGPGRWGSRGDIKLGINVTYSDINNTAMLVEVARKQGNYTPDLSFGTHFFQDLVEASIRYLPLYPDDDQVIFNERFLLGSENLLEEMLPDSNDYRDIIHVIDIARSAEGKTLTIAMNADLQQAVAYLSTSSREDSRVPVQTKIKHATSDDYWKWRYHMAERVAAHINPVRFGVKNAYVFGSTKNATAGPASDIDMLIHFDGTDEQRKELLWWLEGWSLTLAEMNYLKTGYKTDGILDIHLVTDEDIKNKTSYAVKINAVTDAARPLKLMDHN